MAGGGRKEGKKWGKEEKKKKGHLSVISIIVDNDLIFNARLG